MAVPDLYWYGREGKWFGMRQFTVYMLDGVVQVRSFWSRQVCISDSHSTVCNYLLHHFIHLFHYLGADGWLAGGSVRILYCSSDFSCFFPSRLLINGPRSGHGLCCCLLGQFLQWTQYKCLDSLGFLCRIHW